MTERPTLGVVVERLDGIRETLEALDNKVAIQNGRIGKIEIARAEEKGARDAVAVAAAATAAALALKDKSRTWKVTVGGLAVAAIGGIATLAGVAAQLLVN